MTRRTWFTLAVLLIVVVALTSLIAISGCARTTSAGAAVTGTGTVYTCPMHPEVVSPKPGECPKCHMALVKKGS